MRQLPDFRQMPRTWLASLLAGTILLLAGCPPVETETPQSDSGLPLEGAELTLTVVDDPAMAKSAERLRGEWNSQTAGRYSVSETTVQSVLSGAPLAGDAAVVPSWMLGVLAERDAIAPIPSGGSARQDAVFEALRRGEAVYGTSVIALPFGSPVFVCYYRADLLEQIDRQPPRTWDEYLAIARLLQEVNANAESWHGSLEPLAPDWAGLVLLARAAAYAKHRENYSAWFDIQTMEPLIAGPPFVRAMEDLLATVKASGATSLALDPEGVRRAFWSGQAGMAVSWPTAAAGDLPPEPDVPFRAGFAELPGSRATYNVSRARWDERTADESIHVPLLSMSGRLGVINRTTAHTEAALELLCWLSDSHWSPTVSAKSPATTLFRTEQLTKPGAWVEPPVSAEAASHYGAITKTALGRRNWLTALRIPGRQAYLAALDKAVHAAIASEATAQQALDTAAATWRATTESLGLDQQRTAYRRSLGLE